MRAVQSTDERLQERMLLESIYRETEQLYRKPAYQGFHRVVRKLASDGMYGNWVHRYSANEIKWLGLQIAPQRDQLLSAVQLNQFVNRFVTCNFYDRKMGLPQERFMLIAMAAMQDETVQRLQKVQEAYWALSNGYITLSDEIMAFFGKSSRPSYYAWRFHSMDLLDIRISSFLASSVKEKHIRVPGAFLEQVKACASWLVVDMEKVLQTMDCTLREPGSEAFHRAVADPAILHKKLSAIGLMKQLLASEGVVLHFGDTMQPDGRLHSQIQLPRVLRDDVLGRICAIQVRLLNGIAEVWNQEGGLNDIHIEVAGWEEVLSSQRLGLHSDLAVEAIEGLSEEINLHVIKASAQLAKEKGPFLQFEGSSWQSGSIFEQRGYHSAEWKEIRADIETHGIRHGSLRKAAHSRNISNDPLTIHQQRSVINRLAAEQRHSDKGGLLTLEKSSSIEMAELVQLMSEAVSKGIRKIQIISSPAY